MLIEDAIIDFYNTIAILNCPEPVVVEFNEQVAEWIDTGLVGEKLSLDGYPGMKANIIPGFTIIHFEQLEKDTALVDNSYRKVYDAIDFAMSQNDQENLQEAASFLLAGFDPGPAAA